MTISFSAVSFRGLMLVSHLVLLTQVSGCGPQKDSWLAGQDLVYLQSHTSPFLGTRGLVISKGRVAEFYVCGVAGGDLAVAEARLLISMAATAVPFDPARYARAVYVGTADVGPEGPIKGDVSLFVEQAGTKQFQTVTLLIDKAGDLSRLHHPSNGLYLRATSNRLGEAKLLRPYANAFSVPQVCKQ